MRRTNSAVAPFTDYRPPDPGRAPCYRFCLRIACAPCDVWAS